MQALSGVITALATPFTAGGEAIDEAGLRQLVDRTIADGSNALVACASTGEFSTMTQAERHEVTTITIDQTAGRVPVVVNTGALSTAEAVGLSRDAQRRGASAVMPVAPYYDALRLEETVAYHHAIAAAVDVDVVVYNHPDSTGVNLSAADIARLGAEIENVRYVKDSSGSFLQLAELTTRYPDVIQTLCGVDALTLPALELGAAGCVVGTGNFLAGPLSNLWRTWTEGDRTTATAQWSQIVPALLAILDQQRWSFQAAVKAATQLTGLDVGVPRLPLAPLTAQDERDLVTVLRMVPDFADRISTPGQG